TTIYVFMSMILRQPRSTLFPYTTLFRSQSLKKHLIKKIATFLSCLENMTEEEKDEFIERLANKDKNKELFKKLLLVIDRIDETLKICVKSSLSLLSNGWIKTLKKILRIVRNSICGGRGVLLFRR